MKAVFAGTETAADFRVVYSEEQKFACLCLAHEGRPTFNPRAGTLLERAIAAKRQSKLDSSLLHSLNRQGRSKEGLELPAFELLNRAEDLFLQMRVIY